MARLRYNNQSGTLGASLAGSGTTATITFASAPGFATISGSDYIVLVLDAGLAGEEIVYLTAYTSGGTTGTITRAQESTVVSAHSSGTGTWSCSPTALDFITYDPVTGEAKVTDLSIAGLTGATNGTRYVGSWGGPGAPASGTFTIGDFGIDLGTPAMWVYTATGWKNAAAVSSLGSAVQLALTETVTYPPASALKGNTAVLVQQNETASELPRVSTITTNGTIWTITFVSSILGTLGQVADTFSCWTEGFTPSGYNVGSALSPYTATITSSTTITIPNTTTGLGSLTAFGKVLTTPSQYTAVTVPGSGLEYPRAIIEVEGTNTFAKSVDPVYGIGPVIQNAMAYKNATPYSATFNVTNLSNAYSVAGDQRANVVTGARLVGTNVPNFSYIVSVSYDGTNTNFATYNGVFATNYTGSTGTASLKVVPDITTGESVVSAPTTIADGAAVTFPVNPVVFSAPGQGQGWALGYWSGPLFTTMNGGSLSRVNVADYYGAAYFQANTSGLLRWGYVYSDTSTATNQNTGGSLTTQVGQIIGRINNDQTIDQMYGATNNIGSINASSEFAPPQTPMTTVASGSNGVNPATGTFASTGGAGPYTGGTGVLNVVSTAGFPATGSLKVPISYFNQPSYVVLNYTGTTSTTFTGCTFQSGYTGGSLATGQGVLACSSWSNMASTPIALTTATYLPTPIASAMFVQAGSAITLPTAFATIGGSSGGNYTPLYDGQTLKIVNVGTNNITFTSSTVTSTTNLLLGQGTRVLGKGGSINVIWSAYLGLWVEVGYSGGANTAVTTGALTAGATSITGTLSATGLVSTGGTATTSGTTQITNAIGGANPALGSITTATAYQLSTTQDAMLYVVTNTSTTLAITIGPSTGAENAVYSATAAAGRSASIRIPAGWKFVVTATIANCTLFALTC